MKDWNWKEYGKLALIVVGIIVTYDMAIKPMANSFFNKGEKDA